MERKSGNLKGGGLSRKRILESDNFSHPYPLIFLLLQIMKRAQRYYENLCLSAAEAAQLDSESKVADRFAVTKKFVAYWNQKLRDPAFHPGELGGAHNCLFTLEGQALMERLLWELVQIDDKLTNTAYAQALSEIGPAVDRK
jgi:hypothetical protein